MDITDRVYGHTVVNDAVLIELMASAPLQRLKGINQAGAAQFSMAHKTVTRYEHSVGVMLLLRRLGATLEEQIAGLLHDVPHTAFSHVIDFVFPSKEHEFHEQFLETILLQSKIPGILEKYHFKVDTFLDATTFGLLERALPNLCADRIDYTLRDMSAFQERATHAQQFLPYFVAHNDEIMMDDMSVAKDFAYCYLQINADCWAHPKEVAITQLLAEAIKIALNTQVIAFNDLFSEDSVLYQKLKSSKTTEIIERLALIESPTSIIETTRDADYNFYCKTKSRFIDPKVLTIEGVQLVSELFPEFAQDQLSAVKKVEEGYYIKATYPASEQLV